MLATPSLLRRKWALGLGIALVLCALPAEPADPPAADWPQFRGPQRDGISAEVGLLDSWPVEGPPLLWRVQLGSGYSGLSIHDGRIYTMFGRDGEELAAAVDSESGETLWTFRIDEHRKDRQGGGPRSTPTVDDGLVYVLGAGGKLYALSVNDGEPLWNRDLPAIYGAQTPRWGVATSPLVEGNLLIIDVGGRKGESIVAFDKTTGKEVWTAFDDRAGYSAPIAFTTSGVRQVLVFTARHLVAIDPTDGVVLWDLPWQTAYDVNAATPIFIPPNRFFVSSGYDVGGAVYQIEVRRRKFKLKQVWMNREMKNQFSSSVLIDGYLYGFDDTTLKCIDAETGQRRWRERGLGHGSLIFADGHLIVLGDRGTLVWVEATPQAYREKGRFQVSDGKTWTTPSLAGGRLFVRDEKELMALDLAE